MKSSDNHTKRKALVEAFFYRELMSHGRITIPPLGSFLAGQTYTQPLHTDCDMHVRTLIMIKTQWLHLCAHTHTHNCCNTTRKKDVWICTRSPALSSAFSLPLSDREERRVSLWIIILLSTHQSISFLSRTCLCVCVCLSAGNILCSPFFLAENISMWSWTHLSEPDGCLSNCHSPLSRLLCSRLNIKKGRRALA